MNELTDTINTVKNPEQAVREFVGEQFIDWLSEYIPSQINSWPAIVRLKSMKTRPEKIKKFMLQEFLASKAFSGSKDQDPGFLRFAIANLSESADPEAESALEILESKQEQEQNSESQDNWKQLLIGLGSTEEEILHTAPKEATRNYIAELSDVFSTTEWQTAIGGFVCIELANLAQFQAIGLVLAHNTDLNTKNWQFLTAKVNTNHILDKVSFDHETKLLVWEGIVRQLQAQKDFLAALVKYLET